MSPNASPLLLGDWHMSDRPFNQPQPHMFTSFCHNVPLFKHGSNWFLILFSVETRFSLVLDQYTWYKHHACHAGNHDHDGWLWITVRLVPKRAFAFRYIESLGQKIMVRRKNRLSRAVGTSNFRGLVCLSDNQRRTIKYVRQTDPRSSRWLSV